MRNGCYNKPRPVAGAPLQVQDGYSADGTRRMVTVPFVMEPGCQYTLRTPDPRCDGCEHEKKEGKGD